MIQAISFRGDRSPVPPRVKIGFESDNLVESLAFELPEISGDQSAMLMISGNAYANMIDLYRTEDGKWAVALTAEMVGPAGVYESYVAIACPDGRRWNSGVFDLLTGDLPDVSESVEALYPTAVEHVLQEMAETRQEMAASVTATEDAAQRAEDAAQRAENAANQGGGGEAPAKDAVLYTAQTLTEEQQTQARDNIGAASAEAVDKLSEEIERIEGAFPSGDIEHGVSIYDVEWEQGGLTDGAETSSNKRIRSSSIPIGISAFVKLINPETYLCSYNVYGSNDTFLGQVWPYEDGTLEQGTGFTGQSLIVDNVPTAYPTATYIRLAVRNADQSLVIAPEENNVIVEYTTTSDGTWDGNKLDEYYVRKMKAAYEPDDISFMYDVDASVQNKGFLKLPPNYTRNGNPAPMIVFVHGSADIGSINASGMTSTYNDYYNFLRDSGYAVFDCYGYGTKYTSETGGYSNTWGLPINRKCYAAGIDYVCNKYNIDRNNIFVSCKSLGGIQALSMFYDDGLPVKAVGMLAPELDPLNVYMGYSESNKRTIAAELGFSEDTGNVLAFNQGDSVPEGFWDYITENMSKWVGHFAFFDGLPIKTSDKAAYYRKGNTTGDMCRTSLNRPLKIWIAEDDSSVSYGVSQAFIQSLNNGGYKGELRTMPSGTGGHHAVDNDPSALQTTNVTTRCGVIYATIPTAYYELVQFFDRYCTN